MYGASTMGSCYFIIAMTLLGAKLHPSMQFRVRFSISFQMEDIAKPFRAAWRGHNRLFLLILLLLRY